MSTQSAGAKPFNYHNLAKIQKRLVSGALSFQLEPVTLAHAQAAHRPGGGDDEDGGGADGLPNTPPNGYAPPAAPDRPATTRRPATARARCARQQRQGQPELPQRHRRDPAGPGRRPTTRRRSPRTRCTRSTWSPATTTTAAATARAARRTPSTAAGPGTTPRCPTASRRAIRRPRQYWQAGGDTSVAWDTRGNSYLSCQLFNRGSGADPNPDQSSAFAVYRSTGNNGASFNFPGRYAKVFFDHPGTAGVLEDKQLLTVDNNVHSPFRDRVYVTYTEFAADGSGYIYATHSSDYGQTFSAPVLVSRTSPLCTNTFGLGTPHGTCNENQFSDPFVGRDGALYVVYVELQQRRDRQRQPQPDAAEQVHRRRRHASAPRSRSATTTTCPTATPTRATTPAGRCVPEKGSSTALGVPGHELPVRARSTRSTPTGSSSPTAPTSTSTRRSRTAARRPASTPTSAPTSTPASRRPAPATTTSWSACPPTAGATFSGAATDPRSTAVVTQARRPGARPTSSGSGAAFAADGTLAVSYYDRQYGRDEFIGSSDVSLSSIYATVRRFSTTRVTTASMPAPTEFYGTNGGLFYGDYTGLTAVRDAYPIWMDTRSTGPVRVPGHRHRPGLAAEAVQRGRAERPAGQRRGHLHRAGAGALSRAGRSAGRGAQAPARFFPFARRRPARG